MTWVEDPEFAPDKPFGPQTLPYGVLVTSGGPVVAVRVGRHAIPLRALADSFGPRLSGLVEVDSLDPLLAAGSTAWRELRERLVELVAADRAPRGAALVRTDWHTLVLPFSVADYVAFSSSRQHVENTGRILRQGSAPLPENWTHQPIGRHGRAGTVCVSGTDIVRPSGQRRVSGERRPAFGPTRRLDFAAEVGFVCGGGPAAHLSTSDVASHVFGLAPVNDWTARDVQIWEEQPLGPFLAKSFATSMAGWITPLAAFEQARVPIPEPEHALLGHLVETEPWGLDLTLEVRCNETVVSRPPFASTTWSPAQQLAHLTAGGTPVRAGDLFTSGTVSGAERDERGCLLELTGGGAEPIILEDGEQRTFLQDGDRVTLRGTAPGPGGAVIGLGEVTGTVLSAARR